MKKVYGRPVTAPHIELECESKRMKTETIFNAKKNHNFSPACILSERLASESNFMDYGTQSACVLRVSIFRGLSYKL